MFGLFQKILKREREEKAEKLENPMEIDRMLESKYGMPFEDFYDIVESLQTHRLVEAGFDWDEIYEDFAIWVDVALKIGKLRKADERWKRIFP